MAQTQNRVDSLSVQNIGAPKEPPRQAKPFEELGATTLNDAYQRRIAL